MRPLFYITLFTFLPAIAFGKGIFYSFDAFDLANEALNLLGRVNEINSRNHGTYDKKLIRKLLSRQTITISKNLDEKFAKVFEKLEKLPQEFLFLVDRRTLKSNYATIQKISEDLILAQMRMNERPGKVPDQPSDLQSSWNNIRHLITTGNFFTKLSTNWDSYYDKQWELCSTNMSNAQVIYILIGQYLTIATQYFIARNIDLNIQKRKNTVNGGSQTFDGDDIDLYSDIQSELNEDITLFKNIMIEASRDFWTCDKENNPDSPWFIELKAFTKYFTVKKHIQSSCDNGCSNVKLTACTSSYDNGLCSKLRSCPKNLISCKPYLYGINFCSSNCDSESYRRYEFISKGSFKKRCTNTIANNEPLLDSIYTGRTVTQQTIDDARYFECVCPEDKYRINTSPVKAKSGYIVIGARLTVYNKMIVIDAVQGELKESGYIENDELKLPPVHKRYWKNDYEKLNWDDEIDLTPTTVPDNHVVTGFRFNKHEKRFYLELQCQELDSKNKLIGEPQWLTKDTSTLGSEEYSFGAADRPDKSTNHKKLSKENQFVKFNTTGLGEDGGQTTIPFIDTQLVRPLPLTPLSGVSLYVRGEDGFGGFLGVKLQTFNIVPSIISNSNVRKRVGDVQNYLETLGEITP